MVKSRAIKFPSIWIPVKVVIIYNAKENRQEAIGKRQEIRQEAIGRRQEVRGHK
jgi:hypothetical protein